MRAGVERRPWQTTAEFVLGVLDLVGADRGAVARLADLYREARFSDHPMTDEHRREALDALDADPRAACAHDAGGPMTGRRRWWWRHGRRASSRSRASRSPCCSIHGQADELRLALVIALVVCASALLIDAAPVEPAVWTAHVEPEGGLARLDPRTASYLRILESHLSAREADGALRDRLRELADQTPAARHDLAVDDPRCRGAAGHRAAPGPHRERPPGWTPSGSTAA